MRIDPASVQPLIARPNSISSPGALRLAQAYNTQPAAPATPATERTDRVELSGSAALVAGVVPGRVEFSTPTEKSSDSSALPLYRRPADLNSAATGVVAGRIIDVRG